MPRGTISYVNREKGYGFIEGSGGDIFFHASTVRAGSFGSLGVGEEVDYTDKPGDRTRVAISVASLGGSPVIAADMLFVNVLLGDGSPPKRVEFKANSILTADDGTQFRVIENIRQGGNGVVFKAYRLRKDGGIDRMCAVKMLKHLAPQRIDRFANEGRVLQLLNHDFICPYYAAGRMTSGGHTLPWMAMELGGENLRFHVDNQGPVNISKLKRIVPQMCGALHHIHERQFIHRDVKPDNFVWTDDTATDIMMIDYGLAKRFEEDISGRPLDGFTKQLEFVGPVFFSSPELIAYARDKSHVVDHRSDLFQLGKVIWFLATGDISAGIPAKKKDPTGGRLHSIVLELMQDDPAERLPDAKTLAERFGEI